MPKNVLDGLELPYVYAWLWSIYGIAGLHQASNFQWWVEFRLVLAEHDRIPKAFQFGGMRRDRESGGADETSEGDAVECKRRRLVHAA